jgi:hypothetical protein
VTAAVAPPTRTRALAEYIGWALYGNLGWRTREAQIAFLERLIGDFLREERTKK